MYMSYYMFEGAFDEVKRCLRTAQEYIDGEEEGTVSKREAECFKNMVRELYYFLEENNLLNEYGELDEADLDELCEKMKGEE